MIINSADFNQIKGELITLYNISRKQCDFYVMEEVDYLLQKLQSIEVENIKKKQALK